MSGADVLRHRAGFFLLSCFSGAFVPGLGFSPCVLFLGFAPRKTPTPKLLQDLNGSGERAQGTSGTTCLTGRS